MIIKLKHGKISNLTGNLIIYWDLVRDNQQNYKDSNAFNVIAINFMISPLKIGKKFLTSFFPPIPFKNFNCILKKVQNTNCDIIYGGKIRFPNEKKYLNHFYKNHFNQYNKITQIYLKLYKEKFKIIIDNLNEENKLLLIQKLTKKLSSNKINNKNKKIFLARNIQNIIKKINNHHKYDFSPFLNILLNQDKNVSPLMMLYIKKFIAIYYEKYEKVLILNKIIKNKIKKLHENQL